jgi:hypothetical protein
MLCSDVTCGDTQAPLLAVSYRLIGDLSPDVRNARTHSKKQVDQIAAFGFTNAARRSTAQPGGAANRVAGDADAEEGVVAGLVDRTRVQLSDANQSARSKVRFPAKHRRPLSAQSGRHGRPICGSDPYWYLTLQP